jgi:hypothetical protein
MLGRLPGFVAIGEIGRLWDKGLIDNTECGCGLPFSHCPFWTDVGNVAFNGWRNIDAEHAVRIRTVTELERRHLSVPRALPLMVTPQLSRKYRTALREYVGLMGRLYGAIDRVSSGAVIVDSMKLPAHVYAMRRVPGIDLRVLHLVRDSRGVAYSGRRRVARQGGPPGGLRAQSPPVKTAARWMWINLAFHLLARTGVPTMLMRYEDLVGAPRSQLLNVGKFTGSRLRDVDMEFVRDGTVELPADHLVAGNRVRLVAGQVALRADEEWRTALSPRDRRLVELVTWPLLRFYAGREQNSR